MCNYIFNMIIIIIKEIKFVPENWELFLNKFEIIYYQCIDWWN